MRRRAATISVFALLLGVPAVAIAQSGAGDEQYQDPFGSTQTTKSTPAPKAAARPSAGSGLSQTPNLGTSGAGSSTTPSTAAPSGTSGASAGAGASTQLPNTGADPRLLLLAGLSLLLSGLGLRMRTADERF